MAGKPFQIGRQLIDHANQSLKSQHILSKTISLITCSHSNSSKATQRSQYDIFDRKTKLKQRNHTLKLTDHHVFDYLKKDFGYRLFDSLLDIKRNFDVMVELNCGKGFVAPHLDREIVKHLVLCDSSQEMLDITQTPGDGITYEKLMFDEEMIPLKSDSIDIVISNLGLHWVNYLPLTFKMIENSLRQDGVFLCSIFGGQTLYELRCSLQLAEIERKGGLSPHISPFIEPGDIGSLLQAAGFQMPTIDANQVIINYPSIFELLEDLQGMGESNCSWNRPLHLSRDTLLAAASIYKELYGNDDGTVPATFHVFSFIGWKEAPGQPKPAPRGSGNFSFENISELDKYSSSQVNNDHKTSDKK